MSGMSDYAFSIKMRDTITRIAEEVINRVVPPDRYGVVTSIDVATQKCGVTLNGETAPVMVSMGSVKPAATGVTVRVSGRTGDRYIADVIGSVAANPVGIIQPFAGATAPFGWLSCAGQTVLRASYPTLFGILGTTYNWGGEDGTNFRLPYLIDGYEPKGIGVDYPLGEYGGSDDLPQHLHGVNINNPANTVSANHYHDIGGNKGFYVSGTLGTATVDSDALAMGAATNRAWNNANITGTTDWFSNNHYHGVNGNTDNTGTAGVTNTMNPYLALNYIIRAVP